ncbi:hypothetical protein ACFLXE_00015 [Chloroflexota bacterium]
MSKEEDIKCFEQFVESLPEDTYFEVLRDRMGVIRENVRNDHPPFLLIFEPVEKVSELQGQIETLKRQLEEAREYDVRVLNGKLKAARNKVDEMHEIIDEVEKMLDEEVEVEV